MDDGIIGGMKKVGRNGRTPRKPTHTVFVHHKTQMARAGIEESNWPSTRIQAPEMSALHLIQGGPGCCDLVLQNPCYKENNFLIELLTKKKSLVHNSMVNTTTNSIVKISTNSEHSIFRVFIQNKIK